MKYMAFLFAALITCTQASAQAQKATPKIIGKFTDVEGLVTVSIGDQMINVFNGAALVVGTRVLTTSAGSATLSFDNGCDIKLKPNQSIVVKDGSTCAALLASVTPVAAAVASVAVPAAAAAAGAAASGIGINLGLIGGAIGLGAVIKNQNDSKLSGS